MLGVIAVCVLFGLLALLLAFSRWLAHRPWAAAGNLAVAIALLLVAHRLWPPVLHLQSYQAMPSRALVAQVHSERTGPRAYRVTLTRLPAGDMQVFEMSGEEWRLDARTLVWTGRASQLGLPASYRLERLSGRYLRTEAPADSPPAKAATAPSARVLPASFALSDHDEPGEDVWAQARTGSGWKAHIDARHAYGPWRPLADGARFDVSLTHAPGSPEALLESKPANEAAAKAMRYTDGVNVRTRD
jgi:hypothetical protein